MYFSLRITPELFIDVPKTSDFPELQILSDKIIVVEEDASHKHYHLSFFLDIPITTLRSKIQKSYKSKPHAYCLKKQKDSETELNKCYRYLYKGQAKGQLPKVHKTFHTEIEILNFHNQYWDIHAALIEEESTTVVEKAWLYFQLNYTKHDLEELTDRQIKSQIQFNRISKNKPPLPAYTLDATVMYILVKRSVYLDSTTTLKETLDRWYHTSLTLDPEDDDYSENISL